MALELLHNRGRAIAVAGTIAVHAAVLAALLWLAPGHRRGPAAPALVAVPLTEPPPPAPPPPPPDDTTDGAAAPTSRGPTEAPSPLNPPPPIPLARPTPAEPSIDPGTSRASGMGQAVGTGAGQGGEGVGTGSGQGGSGRGAGVITPPARIAGALTHEDYRRADPPRGAGGTVFVSFRVRTDGAVDRCQVLRSSGFAVFDTATCRLIEQRFRFRPARDEAGRAVEWEIRTDFQWVPR
jgi:protein TonB